METIILIFLGLLFAHFLADYPLQGDFLARMKGQSIIVLVAHTGIWAGCISVAGLIMGLDVGILDIGLLFVVHGVADHLRANQKLWYTSVNSLRSGLLIDQLIHVGQIILLMFMTMS